MGWKLFDYRCPECGYEFESMEKSSEDEVLCPAVDEESPNPCGSVVNLLPSANLGWTNDPNTRKEMLKKRSAEHTAKQQKNGNMMSPKDLPKL